MTNSQTCQSVGNRSTSFDVKWRASAFDVGIRSFLAYQPAMPTVVPKPMNNQQPQRQVADILADLAQLTCLVQQAQLMVESGQITQSLSEDHDYINDCQRIVKALHYHRPMIIGQFAIVKLD